MVLIYLNSLPQKTDNYKAGSFFKSGRLPYLVD